MDTGGRQGKSVHTFSQLPSSKESKSSGEWVQTSRLPVGTVRDCRPVDYPTPTDEFSPPGRTREGPSVERSEEEVPDVSGQRGRPSGWVVCRQNQPGPNRNHTHQDPGFFDRNSTVSCLTLPTRIFPHTDTKVSGGHGGWDWDTGHRHGNQLVGSKPETDIPGLIDTESNV